MRRRGPFAPGEHAAALLLLSVPRVWADDGTPAWVWPVVGTECGLVAGLVALLLWAVHWALTLHRRHAALPTPRMTRSPGASGAPSTAPAPAAGSPLRPPSPRSPREKTPAGARVDPPKAAPPLAYPTPPRRRPRPGPAG
eukprot:TRINITY_DN7087_c0_g1_i1.p3 TRINITY_DN7087_c0_g1~~TRINITY_DN7087_c0_g1_i1.p3  ORF type:complete len:140 (-),score=14.27 TRINITY_DN7087_c0_g1_i1:461-880(-)